MTITTSGQISFSDIMNEFNPSGGQSNIKLGDYTARYPDQPDGTREHHYVSVSWNGTAFQFYGGTPPSSLSSFYIVPHKIRVVFILQSTVSVPFYIASTKNETGSDLVSGVTNNGGTYDTNSTYYSNYFSANLVTVDVDVAALGSQTSVAPGDPIFEFFYVNTNTQMTTGGTDVAIRFVSLNRDSISKVTRNIPYVDFAFSSSFSGGSMQTQVGAQPMSGYSKLPGVLFNGQTMAMNQTVAALVNPASSGVIVFCYSPYFYPLTWARSPKGYLNGGYSTGSYGAFGWNTFSPGGSNFIGGPGQPNTATGVATVIDNGPDAPTNFYGAFSSASGWSTSWTRSGTNVTLNITNNTGTDYMIYPWGQPSAANGGTLGWDISWATGPGAFSYARNTPGWGNFYSATRNGVNYGAQAVFTTTDQSGNPGSNFSFYQVLADGDNRAGLIDQYKTYINTASPASSAPGGSSLAFADPGGFNLPSTGTLYPNLRASEPTTGTLRIRDSYSLRNLTTATWNGLTGGQFQYNNELLGSSNTGVTISNQGTVFTDPLNDNVAVRMGNRNMKMSNYYGCKNLGTDGG